MVQAFRASGAIRVGRRELLKVGVRTQALEDQVLLF